MTWWKFSEIWMNFMLLVPWIVGLMKHIIIFGVH